MKTAGLVPELLVSDLKASLKFWCDLLGFDVLYDRPEEQFACLECDGIRVMLEEISTTERQWVPAPLERPFGRGINFEITLADIDLVMTRLIAAQWPFFMDLEEATYRVGQGAVTVRQFVIQDPDGYLLRFSQRVSAHA